MNHKRIGGLLSILIILLAVYVLIKYPVLMVSLTPAVLFTGICILLAGFMAG